MIVKVRHSTCFKDVLPIDFSIEVVSYCNEVNLTVIWYTPHTMTEPPPKETVSAMLRSAYTVFGCRHMRALPSVTYNKKRLSTDQWTFLHEAKFHWRRVWHHCKRKALCVCVRKHLFACLLERYPTDFRWFRTVLADSNRWGNHCLFKTVLLANRFRLTSRPRALFSLRDVIRDLLDRGRSLTSLVNRCLWTMRLTVDWWWSTPWTICLSDIPASRIPMNCHRTAFESCGDTFCIQNKTSRVTSLSNVLKMIRCKSSDCIALVSRHCTCKWWLL